MSVGLRPLPVRRALQAVGAAGLVATALPAWAGCSAAGWSLDAGAERSRWQEFDARGHALLREQGTLGTLELAVQARCAAVEWRLALAQATGRRDYDGRSSTGAPLATTSRIERSTVVLGARLPLADGWSAGVDLGYRWLDRDIAGAGAVQGYAERFSDGQLLAALQHVRDLGERWRLAVDLGLGGGPPGRLRLQLPHADAAVLRLGSGRSLQAGLVLSGSAPAERATGWRLQLRYRHDRLGAGAPTVLLRRGLPVGAAAQPAIRQTSLGLQAGFAW